MSSNTLVDLVLKWLPYSATGPSTLRGYETGTLKALREELAKITASDLRGFATSDEQAFRDRLDFHTQPLQKISKNVSWGAARKVLNIYLRNAVYNHYVREALSLHLCEPFLEVPLDRLVGTALRKDPHGADLPVWKTLGDIQSQQNDEFQAVALKIADEKNLRRIHLDLIIGLNSASSEILKIEAE
jgi:hypothetical protein